MLFRAGASAAEKAFAAENKTSREAYAREDIEDNG